MIFHYLIKFTVLYFVQICDKLMWENFSLMTIATAQTRMMEQVSMLSVLMEMVSNTSWQVKLFS